MRQIQLGYHEGLQEPRRDPPAINGVAENSREVDEVDAIHRRFRRGSSGSSGGGGHRRAPHPDMPKRDHKDRPGVTTVVSSPEKAKSLRHSRPLGPPGVNQAKEVPYTETKPTENLWQCYACTYENAAGAGVCEMCGKSRDSPDLYLASVTPSGSSANGDEEDGVGGEGVVCSKCTLINPPSLSVCEACGATLPPGGGWKTAGGGGRRARH